MKSCCHGCVITTRAVGQYVRRSRAEWAGLVEEYQQSGKSRDVFSVERVISVKSLGYHLLKQGGAVRTGPRALRNSVQEKLERRNCARWRSQDMGLCVPLLRSIRRNEGLPSVSLRRAHL